ncbi:MAG: ribonuclease E/G [Pseudomonadota bacterium]
MAKKMLIDATHAEETRVVVVEGNKVEEFDFESLSRRQLAGNIYLAKVTRVEPSLQAAFVDYGGNRHGFLAFSEIHPDYYQIPTADREALIAEEMEYNKSFSDEDDEIDDTPVSKSPKIALTQAQKMDETFSDVLDDDTTSSDDTGLVDVPESTPDVEDAKQEEEPATPLEEDEAQSGVPSEDSPDIDVIADASVKEGALDSETEDASGTGDDLSSQNDDTSNVEKDTTIEAVADDDSQEEVRPRRKPRPRRYKIQEVIKTRQIILVQVVKEERGNKGAALTTYLSLAGRYCVLMPNTARGGGISRKITNAVDRKKLKSIASEIEVPQGAGLIIRTAGAKRSKAEIKRDYEYLIRQWEAVRDLTLKSIAPAPIYAEGDLIKRSIRDLYSKDIDEIIVEGMEGFEKARDYMRMLTPSHAKNVKHYSDMMPLFSRYQVENYLSGMMNPTVQLKSGGYLVIAITEALVAVDVNSGRSTKEGSVEDTALKTNLEAAEEVARQCRLRDLAGLIVIDFIDMEERKNNSAVEKRLKDNLKNDRARIQIGRISGFGLLEMSRQRLRPGMFEATTTPCPHCQGTGVVRSNDNQALSILREIEEEATRQRSKEVLVTVPMDVANYMHNQKREHIAAIEARFGLSVRIEANLQMISPNFEIERFKTATRVIAHSDDMPLIAIDMPEEVEEEPVDETIETDDEQPKKRRRRRRRRGGRGRNASGETAENTIDQAEIAEPSSDEPEKAELVDSKDATKIEKPDSPIEDVATEEKSPTKPKRKYTRKKKTDSASAPEDVAAPTPATSEKKKPKTTNKKEKDVTKTPASKPKAAASKTKASPKQELSEAAAVAESEPDKKTSDEASKTKRRGWWSLKT